MKYSFNKKIIAITGAANGIGRAASILLAKEGATIIAIDKDKIALNKLKTKLKKNCVLKNINCTDIDDINKNLKDIKELVDITDESNPDTLVDNVYDLPETDADVIDGFRLTFDNVEGLGFNRDLSYWNSDSIWTFDVARYYTFNVVGSMLPYNYRVIFTESISDTSLDLCMRSLPN